MVPFVITHRVIGGLSDQDGAKITAQLLAMRDKLAHEWHVGQGAIGISDFRVQATEQGVVISGAFYNYRVFGSKP